MPNDLNPAVSKQEMNKIQDVVRGVIYSLTMGHLAEARGATPDLRFKITGTVTGSGTINIEIVRREDVS